MTPKERIINRVSILKEMNSDILKTKNPTITDVWFENGIKLFHSKRDLIRIACDYEEYDRVVRLYFNLMRIARCL